MVHTEGFGTKIQTRKELKGTERWTEKQTGMNVNLQSFLERKPCKPAQWHNRIIIPKQKETDA